MNQAKTQEKQPRDPPTKPDTQPTEREQTKTTQPGWVALGSARSDRSACHLEGEVQQVDDDEQDGDGQIGLQEGCHELVLLRNLLHEWEDLNIWLMLTLVKMAVAGTAAVVAGGRGAGDGE